MNPEQDNASCWPAWPKAVNYVWCFLLPLRWFLARAHYVLLPFVHLYTMVRMLGDEEKIQRAVVSAIPMLLIFTSLLLFLITATQNSDLDLSNMNDLNKNELADYVYNNADETMKSTMDTLLNADTLGTTDTQIILDAAGETEKVAAFEHLNDTPEFRENQKELKIPHSNLATAGTVIGALGFVGRLLDNQIKEAGDAVKEEKGFDWTGPTLLNICCLLLMLAPIFIGLVYASGCGIADYGVGEGGVFVDKQFHDVMVSVAPIWCVTLLFIGLISEGINCKETQKNLECTQDFLDQKQVMGNETPQKNSPFQKTVQEMRHVENQNATDLEPSESTSNRILPNTPTKSSTPRSSSRDSATSRTVDGKHL